SEMMFMKRGITDWEDILCYLLIYVFKNIQRNDESRQHKHIWWPGGITDRAESHSRYRQFPNSYPSGRSRCKPTRYFSTERKLPCTGRCSCRYSWSRG